MKRIISTAPAIGIACLALAVALGGTSYAAFVLPANSVGATQVKRNAIVGKKIAKNAVTSVKVKNGTLLAADFKAGQVPTGPQGPVGLQGPKGDQGDTGAQGPAGPKGDTGAAGPKGDKGDPGTASVSGYQVVASPGVNLDPGEAGNTIATCPPGKKAIGGGYSSSSVLLETYASAPINNSSAWNAAVKNVDSQAGGVTAYVVCASVS